MADDFACTRVPEPGGHRILVAGEIDMNSAPAFAKELKECTEGDVTVDFSRVEFMDSSGLGVLIVAREDLAERGDALKIVDVPENVLRVLQLTGLDQVFDVQT